MNFKLSDKIWKQSKEVLVGGVNSPVRSFRSVGRNPIVMKSGKGCFMCCIDGNTYLDFLNSWGPLILGHAFSDVTNAICKQATIGTSYGTVTEYEYKLADLIVNNIPHIDLVRFVNSGTEAVMTAIRLARGVTGKSLIIKFTGCYHGHSDSVLVQAGSGLMETKSKSSNGISLSTSQETFVIDLDNENQLDNLFVKNPNNIATVIIEPLPANSGLLPQRLSFLKKIRTLTKKHNALLILDETITGFRLGFGGFAQKYSIVPDIVTYGKIIGGGMPIGAIAGKKKIMNCLAPKGSVYQAGTLSGNPIAMSAGYETLNVLLTLNVYEHLSNISKHLQTLYEQEILPLFKGKKFSINLVIEDSIFWLCIHDQSTTLPLRSTANFYSKAPAIYAKMLKALLLEGVYIAPSSYEVGFLSYPMQKKDIEFFITKLKKIFRSFI